MKKTKLKRKKQRQIKLNILTIIVILLIIILIRNIYMSFVKNRITLLDNPVKYEEIINSTALVVRDEQVYAKSGNINLDGSNDLKIKVDSNIGDLSNLNKIELNLEEVENAINIISEETENTTESIDTEKTIQSIRNKDYKTISEIPTFDNAENSIEYKEHLLNRYEIYKKILETNGVNMKSLNSGIISNRVDGYEDIYNIYNINLKDYNINLENINIDEDVKYSGLKIINNQYYALIFKVESEKIKQPYEINDSIKIRINDSILDGTIKDISLENDAFTIAAFFDTGFEETKNLRFTEIEVINYSSNSYEISKKSLTSKDDIDGVYIKDPSGVVKFKPVKILSKKDNKYIIDSGYNGKIEINEKEYDTIQSFDEIIKNPKKVKLGELIE